MLFPFFIGLRLVGGYEIKVNGTDIDSIMPPVSRFGGKRKKTKEIIIEILQKFFDKYFGI